MSDDAPEVAPPLAPGGTLLIATPLEWREACLSVPAMRALQRYVDRVKVLCPDNQLAFWAASGFREGEPYPARAGAREIQRRLEDIYSVLLWEPGPAADACVRAKVPKRYGPAIPGLAKSLTDPVAVATPPGPIRHRVDFYLRTVDALGAQAFVAENFTTVATGKAREMSLLLAPDSDFGRHYEWPVERWIALGKELLEHGAKVHVAVAGPAGEALAAGLEGVPSHPLDYPGLDLLSQHYACVTADSSLPHFATHVGTTCVALFGPGEPEWMRPLGKHHHVVRAKAECSPCFASKCPMDLRCQNDLTVAEVLQTVLKLG